MWHTNYDNGPILYLIPTPIGNLEDITYRSVRILGEVSVVFSEDTRVTGSLLDYLGIKKKLVSLHDHNEDIVKLKVLEYLENGEDVALVTDRGTPVISDPGFKTVEFVASKNYSVVALPGACAFVPALVISGIAPKPFMFYGFLDSKKAKRKHELEKLKFIESTIIFYEAPHRIMETMKAMLEIFGDRNISLSKEISKKFENVYRGNISSLIPTLDGIKGEFVVVVEGFHDDNFDNESLSVVDQIKFYIDNGMDTMTAVKTVAKEKGMKKNDVYALYHKN